MEWIGLAIDAAIATFIISRRGALARRTELDAVHFLGDRSECRTG